ncbi:related to actin-like protein [Phialocephala subalpina]|uniref:Actin-like protein ARP6 n=1 Tax=Phialocephala subalpina TaxID=576137 RepID=A0A1L7XMV0_9HELO|nr:related to actin-like protein [Phialocephala subalpina]
MSPTQRRTKSSGPAPPAKTLVLDNGAHTIKAGFSGLGIESPTPSIIPNCLARDRDKKVYIGSSLSACKDFSEIVFRRPVEKGYLVNWEAEKEIWEHEFFDAKAPLHCDPKETGLILTEAPNALPALQTFCDQVVFEEFGFARYLRCLGPQLNAYNDIQSIYTPPSTRPANLTSIPPAEIMMLIDSSYSHTTITPLLLGRPIQSAIRRLDVGGKLLTNYVTRLLSLRQYDMRNDTYLVNEIKEATCYITTDFKEDMEKTWKGPKGDRRAVYETSGGIAKDYVLPDYHSLTKGFVRDHDPDAATKLKEMTKGKPIAASEDVLTLRNERFTVPELLFIFLSYRWVYGQAFLANIIVVGGNANIEGFIPRLQMDMRALAPAECIVRVAKPSDPIVSTWQGGASLARDEDRLAALSVTKEDYDEHGSAWVARKFGGR